MNYILRNAALISATALLPATSALAGIKYQDGDKYLNIGGRIQVQYHYTDPDVGDSTDDLFFRRLRADIEGSLHKDWKGIVQFDLGDAEGENEVAVKDAFFEYKKYSAFKFSIGNKTFPFSREQITSSKSQQVVERTFVGDHNYGTPDRQLGLHLDGKVGKIFKWAFSGVQAGFDPDNKKLDFDSLAIRDEDFNQGWMYGGRLDFGNAKFSQTDFDREFAFGVGVAAFNWTNDEDNIDTSNGSKSPVDTVTGFELSAAIRVIGFSIDAQYNLFDAELMQLDAGTILNQGIYDANGETTLENAAIEGGFLLPGNAHELVAAYQVQDADGYAEMWTRMEVGYNYYFTRSHDIKLQFTYRINEDKDGKKDNDVDEFFLQAQYVF